MCKADNFFYLVNSTLFKLLLKIISWQVLSQKWMITVPNGKYPSAKVKENCANLSEKVQDHELRSPRVLVCYENILIVLL